MKCFLVSIFCFAVSLFAQVDSSSVVSDSVIVEQTFDSKPGSHELFLMPTAYCPPAGTIYFTDYMLFILNFGYSFGSTQVNLYSVFPFTLKFYHTVTISVKQKTYSNSFFSNAVYGYWTPASKVANFGSVISLNYKDVAFHGSVSVLKNLQGDNKTEYPIDFGFTYNASKRVSLVIEYLSTSESISDDFTDAVIMLGAKLMHSKFNLELGVLRPLGFGGESGMFLIPVLKGTIIF